MADAMLGSLARKLRAFGFDTLYYKEGDDEGIISLTGRTDRILLTSDRVLHDRASSRGVPALLISGQTDGKRITSLLASARDAGITFLRGAPLCSLCGGSLVKILRKEAEAVVPTRVVSRHRQFLRCSACGKVYWRGGHWKKLSHLERVFGPRNRSSGDS